MILNLLKSASLISCCLFVLTACSSKPVRNYYVLSSVGSAPARNGLGIGVGPVSFSPYLLERANLIFQSSDNKIEFSEDHVWAGDLRGDFARVLANNLGRRLNTGSLKTYPWQKESELDYQITVDIVRFQGTPDGEAVLEANWSAYRLPGGNLVRSSNTTVRDDLLRDGFEELAASQSRLVDKLSAVIAGSLQ